MSRSRRLEIVEHSRSPSSSYSLKQTSSSLFNPPRSLNHLCYFPSFPIVEDELDLCPLFIATNPPIFFDDFDTVTDLIQIDRTPFHTSTRRVIRRVGLTELRLQTLSNRLSTLELGLDRLLNQENSGKKKYSWTAVIKSPENDRKYKWTAETKDGEDEKKGLRKTYKLTAEIKCKGAVEQTYTIEVSKGVGVGVGLGESKKKRKKKIEKVKEEKGKSNARIVEIEGACDDGGLVLRQAFAKRMDKRRGKRNEFSPQDAATLIQKSFRAYLIRRSQALRALRELAIAKTKLKEIRALFNNFSYRHRLSRYAEERQRFSEKIIVLLLTVDDIEGSDLMVRAAKKSMVDELEAMLDAVDPQPVGKSLSFRRRTFDMPDGVINKELAAGVAQVVRMLDQEATSSEISEACL